MCKKFFHPASRDNLKRVWMAEQQAEAYKKKQEELRVQYEKEQDLHNNKALLSKESKDKLSVNFMYEPPPGAKKEREKEDNEPEYKFEWQRKYNAPRESYCKGDSEIRDQPFGIQVRNVRCIKCHKWGHINTDKECPLYSQAMSMVLANDSQTPSAPDALTLVRQMREDGLALKKSALSAQQHLRVPEHEHLMISDDEEQSEMKYLKTLSKRDKKKLLKKLERLEKKAKKTKLKKKKQNKKRLQRKKNVDAVSDTDDSCSSSSSSGSSSSSSDSSSSTSGNNDNSGNSSSSFRERRSRINGVDKVSSKSSSKSRSEKERTKEGKPNSVAKYDVDCHSRADKTKTDHKKRENASKTKSRNERSYHGDRGTRERIDNSDSRTKRKRSTTYDEGDRHRYGKKSKR